MALDRGEGFLLLAVAIVHVSGQGVQQLPYKFQVGVRVGSSRVDLQACKLEYSIVSPK